MTEEQFKRLKRDVEESKAEAERAQGSLQEIQKTVQREYGVNSLKEAKALLKRLQMKLETEESLFDEKLQEYERKWKSNER